MLRALPGCHRRRTDTRLRAAVQAFAAHLRCSSEYSSSTAKAYSIDVAQFLEYLEESFPDCWPEQVTPAIAQAYRERLAALKPATISRKLSALSAFLDWLWRHGEVAANPVTAVRRPRRKESETKWVTAEDSVALLAACRDDRERAIFATYLRAALRYSELMALRLVDVDLGRNELRVVGKGRLRRGCRSWTPGRHRAAETDATTLVPRRHAEPRSGSAVKSDVVPVPAPDHPL